MEVVYSYTSMLRVLRIHTSDKSFLYPLRTEPKSSKNREPARVLDRGPIIRMQHVQRRCGNLNLLHASSTTVAFMGFHIPPLKVLSRMHTS